MPRIFSHLAGMLLVPLVAGCSTPTGAKSGATDTERGSSSTGKSLVLAAPDLDGRVVDVGADSGKVRVVDFWATWCEPCKEAMPVLDAMARELGPRGLTVYGISIDEDRAQVLEFLQKTPVSFPVLWDKGAVQVSRFDVSYMPVTLLVDRKGIIRHVHQGWDEERSRRERAEVEALLAEP
jgi:cytochrome c biogenesis protein CcmG, thiol:disulfide interchange protein DsbE